MDAAQHQKLQDAYLRWIDEEIGAGHTVKDLNRSLEAAGLVYRDRAGSRSHAEEIGASRAGFVGPLEEVVLPRARALFAVSVPLELGAGCQFETTVLLYDRRTRRREAAVRAHGKEAGPAMYLSAIDIIASKDAGIGESEGWLVASSWVASGCASVWNGKTIRIDRLSHGGARPLLVRDLRAKFREPVSVAVQWQRGIATFDYEGAISDSDLLSVAAIARYRIDGDRVNQETPLALTRAGFIEEWLRLTDDEARRWSEAQPLMERAKAAAGLLSNAYEWGAIQRQPGNGSMWTVTLAQPELKAQYVLRVAGTRASELRIVSLEILPLGVKAERRIPESLEAVAQPLPW